MRLATLIVWGGLLLAAILLIASVEASPISTCTSINAPGSYELSTDLTANGLNCINIYASNVSLNCYSHLITSSATGGHGIFLQDTTGRRLTNVTIANCRISRFSNGIYIFNTENSTIAGNVFESNAQFGIVMSTGSRNISIANNIIANNTLDGILASIENQFTGNDIYNNRYGVQGSTKNTFSQNNIYSNAVDGILFDGGTENIVYKNEIHNNARNGVLMASGGRNNVTDNNIYANGDRGLRVDSSNDNTIWLNTVNRNGEGILVAGSRNNFFIDNTVFGSSGATGFSLIGGSTYNTLRNNTVYDNDFGFRLLTGSANNFLDSNTAYGNDWNFYFAGSSSNTITNNQANDTNGFYFQNSNDNTIFRNYINAAALQEQNVQQPPQEEPIEPITPYSQPPQTSSGGGGGGGAGGAYYPTSQNVAEQPLTPLSSQQIQQYSSPRCTSGQVLIGESCLSISALGICGEEIHLKTDGKCCSGQWIEGAVSCPTSRSLPAAGQQRQIPAAPIKSELPIILGIGVILLLLLIAAGIFLFMKNKPSLKKAERDSAGQIATKVAAILAIAIVISALAGPVSQTFYTVLHLQAQPLDVQHGFYFSSSNGNNVTANVVQSVQNAFVFSASSNNTVNDNSACGNPVGFDFNTGAASNAGSGNEGKITGNRASNSGFQATECAGSQQALVG